LIFDLRHIALFCIQIQISDIAFNGTSGYGSVYLIPVASRLTRMVTDPSADGREGARFLDEFQGLPNFPLGSKVNISLDIDVRRALCLARSSILFFRSGFAFHRIAAIALVIVVENDPCLRVRGDGILWAGDGARGVFTMMAIQWLENRSSLENPHHSGANAQAVFLLAGHFTGMAATTIVFVEHQ
jgi:hypothetical protein